ncbi:MAG: response regulator [Nitrospirota bacterium]
MIVSCSQCGVRLKIDELKIKEGGARMKCPKCGNIFLVEKPAAAEVRKPEQPFQENPAPPEPSRPPLKEPVPAAQKPPEPGFTLPSSQPSSLPPKPVEKIERPQVKATPAGPKWELDSSKIVVAHDGESVLGLVASILAKEGYQVITEVEGIAAVVAIEKEKPFLVILDVALPRIYGFEICDRLKNSPESSDVKVILIASIYDKTRYKREPVSLYGADDYIEKHHIQDSLAQKVKRLTADAEGAPTVKPPREQYIRMPAPEDIPLRQEQGLQMRKDEIPEPPVPSIPLAMERQTEPEQEIDSRQTVDSQLVEAARRFARIILSDIALYNQGAVEEGIRAGNFEEALAAELKEGRELYNGRVSGEVMASGDYFAEEIVKFVDKKRQTMGLGM